MRAWIEATITPGGFSSERAYEVRCLDGLLATGLVNEQYVSETNDGSLLQCRVRSVAGTIATIELPAIPEIGTGGIWEVLLCDLLIDA